MSQGVAATDLFTLLEACDLLLGGRVKPSTLRAEARRGRLTIIRLGRQDFVTRVAIDEMLEKCRLPASYYGVDQVDEPTFGKWSAKRRTSFSMEESISPQDALRAQLRKLGVPSRLTSTADTGRSAT